MKTVFVSSTFKDMQHERDAIREITAPILNVEARKHGDEFDFCDLRWGIDTSRTDPAKSEKEIERENNLKVLNVCFDEIDRCKPPMIVILGYRYGWIPENGDLIKEAADRKGLQIEDLCKSVTALEIEYGSLSDDNKFKNTLFYFREIDGVFPTDFDGEDDEHTYKMNALKRRIRKLIKKIGGHIKEYHLKWNGNGFDGVKEFAHMLAEDIKEMLMPQWLEYEKLTPFQKERMTHYTFISEKSEMFRARKKEADELIRHIKTEPVTIIKGEVGSGKSTLFSYIAKNMESTEWAVLPFVSGLTSQSDTAFEIMENTVYFLEDKLGIKEHYIDEKDHITQLRKMHSVEEWREKLAELCWRYTENGKKLLVMVDAADQLTQSEERDKLYFIPTNAGENIHFVMTCTTDFETVGRDYCTLKEIDVDGKYDVINGTLARSGKQLSKPVIDKMLTLSASNNPLYLSLLVQRLTMMNKEDFTEIKNKGDGMSAIEQHQISLIEKNCPDNLEKMSAELLLEAGRRINSELVRKAGLYLAVSRAGLRKKDLSVLLGDTWTDNDFSHFISYMNDCFMIRDDGRYDFMHKSIRIGFLRLCPDVDTVNRQILTHLKSLHDDDPVRVREFIYHTIKADDKEFFVDYVIKNYFEKQLILPAALDTYEKCISDGGKWMASVLHWAENNTIKKSEYCNLSYFSNNELSDCFKGSQQEFEIQLFILKNNAGFAEKLNSVVSNYDTKRSLSVSYGRIAGIYEQLGGHENLERALMLYNKDLELSKQLAAELDTADSRIDLSISYHSIAGIYQRLDGRENLERALGLYNKCIETFEQLAAELGTADSRRGLSVNYSRVAGIYEKLGGQENFESALGLYQKCLEMRERLAAELGTAASRIDLLKSHDSVAGIYKKLGGQENLERALGLYNEALELSKQLAAELGTAESRSGLSVSYNNVAVIYKMLGGRENLECALGLYNKGLELSKQLAAELGTAESRRELSVIYNNVAGIYQRLGGRENLECALGLYNKGLELSKQLAAELGTAESKRALSISYAMVAGIYENFGGRKNLERALELYNKGLELSEQLTAELGTADSRGYLSFFYNKVAGIYDKLGGQENLKCALELYNKFMEISKQLAAELGTAESRRNLSLSYNDVAVAYEKLGGRENLECAFELYNKFMEISEQLAAELGTAESRVDLSLSYNNNAIILEKLGGHANLERALELYKKCLEMREQLVTELSTVNAYDDLAVSLYKIAMHEMTPMNDKKPLLERALSIAKMLLGATQMDRYQKLVDEFTEALQKQYHLQSIEIREDFTGSNDESLEKIISEWDNNQKKIEELLGIYKTYHSYFDDVEITEENENKIISYQKKCITITKFIAEKSGQKQDIINDIKEHLSFCYLLIELDRIELAKEQCEYIVNVFEDKDFLLTKTNRKYLKKAYMYMYRIAKKENRHKLAFLYLLKSIKLL